VPLKRVYAPDSGFKFMALVSIGMNDRHGRSLTHMKMIFSVAGLSTGGIAPSPAAHLPSIVSPANYWTDASARTPLALPVALAFSSLEH